MKAKEYLEGIKKLDIDIGKKIDKLAELNVLAEKTTVAMNGERVQSSGSKEQMADCTIKIIMLKQEINDDIDRLVDYKNNTKKLLKEIENKRYRKILFKKYIKYKSLYRIAEENGWDYENVKHSHKKALEQFEEKMEENTIYSIDI